MRVRSAVLAAGVLMLAHAQLPAVAAAAPAAAGDVRLSNEWTTTTWAYGLSTAGIFARPSTRARRIGRVQFETENGFPEVYVLLVSHVDAAGREWVRLRVPGRPNGRTGWVLRSAVGSFEQTHWLIVVSLRARESARRIQWTPALPRPRRDRQAHHPHANRALLDQRPGGRDEPRQPVLALRAWDL